jgi:hypothetical protein
MDESGNYNLRWAKVDGIFSKNSWLKKNVNVEYLS